jgi:hypothetical protein
MAPGQAKSSEGADREDPHLDARARPGRHLVRLQALGPVARRRRAAGEVKRSCLECGASFSPRSRTDRRCPIHQGSGTGWSHNRDSAKQAAFRRALIERAGGRCEETDAETGRRCTETQDLRACHLVPLVEGGGYELSNGKLRCARHDRATDRHAR